MLQVRCQKCGWAFTLGRDAVAHIMEEIKDSHPKHYMLECPKCRQGIKLQTKQIRRVYRPAPTEE